LFGTTFGSPGPDRAQGPQMAPKRTVWNHFRVSWPGSGPGTPDGFQKDRLESHLGLPARIGPRDPQMAPKRTVWNHIWASRPGSGPETPRWLPGDRLESHLGLLARIWPRDPQMTPRRPFGITFGPDHVFWVSTFGMVDQVVKFFIDS
jgi:hypothetical protein